MKVLRIDDSTVTNATVGDDADFCERNFGGRWVVTDDDRIGIGWTLHDDGFRPPQPYPSWTWQEGAWTAPVPQPDGDYWWDEDAGSWVEWVEPDEEL